MTVSYAPSVPPLDQPDYTIGFPAALRRGLAKYAVFHGRAGRREFWWWCLGQLLAFLTTMILTLVIGGATADAAGNSRSPLLIIPGVLGAIWLLGSIVPNIAISIRRLHDAGHSGTLYLLNFLNVFGYIGAIIVLVFCALPSSPRGLTYDRPVPGRAPVIPPHGYPGQPAPAAAPSPPSPPPAWSGPAEYGQPPTAGDESFWSRPGDHR